MACAHEHFSESVGIVLHQYCKTFWMKLDQILCDWHDLKKAISGLISVLIYNSTVQLLHVFMLRTVNNNNNKTHDLSLQSLLYVLKKIKEIIIIIIILINMVNSNRNIIRCNNTTNIKVRAIFNMLLLSVFLWLFLNISLV